jgi:hypothetical protein
MRPRAQRRQRSAGRSGEAEGHALHLQGAPHTRDAQGHQHQVEPNRKQHNRPAPRTGPARDHMGVNEREHNEQFLLYDIHRSGRPQTRSLHDLSLALLRMGQRGSASGALGFAVQRPSRLVIVTKHQKNRADAVIGSSMTADG